METRIFCTMSQVSPPLKVVLSQSYASISLRKLASLSLLGHSSDSLAIDHCVLFQWLPGDTTVDRAPPPYLGK